MTASFPIVANGQLYNQEHVEYYIARLFGTVDWQDGQVISLLGIGEKGTSQEGVFREREMIPPAFVSSAHRHLKRWAEHHVAGFIVPAVVLNSDAKVAKLDNVSALTAIILDIDSGDVTAKFDFAVERLGKPSMVVASGGKTEEGKFKAHVYWMLTEPCEDVERVAALRKTLAAKVGGDQSFGRATQVVRIPGTVHAKNGNATVCKFLDRADVDYDLEELADIIENMQPMPGLPAPKQAELPAMTGGMMDFTPAPSHSAVEALHRDVEAGGEELTRWGEFSKVAGFYISEARAGRITAQAAYTAANGWMLEHMVPPWPQERFDTEFRALVNEDVRNHGPFPVAAVAQAAAPSVIEPTPATFPDASMIPPRPWLHGHWLQRGQVTAVIAPGGVGKSSLMSVLSMALASNEPLLRQEIFGGPLATWYWNLEDSGDNLARSRIAAMRHYGVSSRMIDGRMFVDSGPEGARLCIAVEDRSGFTIIYPTVEAVIDAIKRHKIDVLIVDPFVSSHQVNENDNNKIDAVAKEWSRVAHQANCSVVLVHHTSKLKGEAVTADSARGAGALNNAARITLVLNRMNQVEAEMWGLDEDQRKRRFSVVDDKHNHTPPEAAAWFELVSVNLDNASDIYPADNVGVVVPWFPPRAMDGVDAHTLWQVQKVVSTRPYWRDSQATQYGIGEVLGGLLKFDHGDAAGKARVNKIVNTWIASGALKLEPTLDPDNPKNRRLRPAVVVGRWVERPANMQGDEQWPVDQ